MSEEIKKEEQSVKNIHAYMSINLLEIKEGRPYSFNIPQLGQDFSEVYEIIEDFKKQVKDIEEKNKQKFEAEKDLKEKDSK